jgi:hypothetical protein
VSIWTEGLARAGGATTAQRGGRSSQSASVTKRPHVGHRNSFRASGCSTMLRGRSIRTAECGERSLP